jgi:hypothetical protein
MDRALGGASERIAIDVLPYLFLGTAKFMINNVINNRRITKGDTYKGRYLAYPLLIYTYY